MKNMTDKMTKTIAVCAMALALASGSTSYAGVNGQSAVKVPADVTDIVIELEDVVSITLVKSADTLGVKDSKKAESRVVTELSGGAMMVKVAAVKRSGKDKNPQFGESVKLLVPSDKKITVNGKNMVLSGDLAAKSVTVKADTVSVHAFKAAVAGDFAVTARDAELKMILTGVKKLALNVEHLTGNVKVPAATEIPGPEHKSLKVQRI